VEHRREYVMPAPTTDLKINFGGAVSARHESARHWDAQSQDGWVTGLWDRYHCVQWPTDLDYIGITFRPGGTSALFGIDAHRFANDFVPIEALFGAFAIELRERLAMAPDVQTRFALLERLLTLRLRDNRDFDRLTPALQRIKQTHGRVSIVDLAVLTDVSTKHLVTLFNRVVGAPPKTLTRLYRLQHLLSAILANPSPSLTSLAYDCAYFDQAHFIKDFKRLTGHTPGNYLRQRTLANNSNPKHTPHPRLLPQLHEVTLTSSGI
jgi:AraC-like DNA-binding protein